MQSYEKAIQLANKLVNKLVNENRRSLDALAAKCYFYYSRIYELVGQLETIRRYDPNHFLLHILRGYNGCRCRLLIFAPILFETLGCPLAPLALPAAATIRYIIQKFCEHVLVTITSSYFIIFPLPLCKQAWLGRC